MYQDNYDPICENITCGAHMLIFNHLLFGHFVLEDNKIWYLEGALTGLPRYKISLASCSKWPNSE